MNPTAVMLSVALALGQSSTTKRLSDRQQDEFIGPAKQVVVEWSPLDGRRSDVKPGTRCRAGRTLYDKDGRVTQKSVYPGSCGGDEIRDYYLYDQNGIPTIRTETIQGKGSPPDPPPIAGAANRVAGAPRDEVKYDSAGRLVEHKTVASNGAMISMTVNHYDDKGRLVERTGYDQVGMPDVRRVYTYEATSLVPSSFKYLDGRGRTYEHSVYSEYEFNSFGDWIKRKETTEETTYIGDRRLIQKGSSLLYRQIEYY